MKLGIMQPYFFPYIGYWQLMNAVDQYVIYDDVNFIKSGWINRNRILMNGESRMINIRMHNASYSKHINEIELFKDPIYNRKLLKTIESCYKKAPYFEEVYPVIADIINQSEKNMARFLEYSIRKVCEYLSINTKLLISSEIKKNNYLKGQDKVIEICKILGAEEYCNAVGGQSLYSFETFKASGIKLRFLKTNAVEYRQFRNDFVPNLSIIDVMMFNSKERINEMLDNFEVFE